VILLAALKSLRRLVADIRTAATMPRIDVVVSFGGSAEDEILRSVSRPHPRYRVVGRKAVGVALLPLGEYDDVEAYLANHRYARRRVRRAARLGYRASLFDPNERRGELLRIHASIPERQGRPIDAAYLDKSPTYELAPHREHLGIMRDDIIVAYSELEYAGEIVGTSRIMGHGDYLADGIMFFLVSSIVEHVKTVRPRTRYIYYDTFFGAGEGLRAFKRNTGFQPYYVRWRRKVTTPSVRPQRDGVVSGKRGVEAPAPFRRLYRDYIQRERLDEFETLLQHARDQRYVTMTLSEFAERGEVSPAKRPERILLLRHDIDSDVARARRMWEIERRIGVIGSYFFRLCTWDVGFMRELSATGFEVGYHYEELATLIKEQGATTPEEARELRHAAGIQLRATVDRLRATSGLALDVFAAHGDFANRVVGVSNHELLLDSDLRKEIGVRLEAYDIESGISVRSSDHGNGGWCPADPGDAIRQGAPVIEVLVHPRAWGGAPLVNARADLGRLGEGGRYRIRRARRQT
jgi:hypothetical protein